MILERTSWPPFGDNDGLETVDFAIDAGASSMDRPIDQYAQPGFGIDLGWNSPAARWWQPYFVVQVWTWRLQLGWFYT